MRFSFSLLRVSLLLCLLFIVGCSGGGSSDGALASVNYERGSGGLELRVDNDFFSREFYADRSSRLLVTLENDAAYPVTDVVLAATSYDQAYLDFIDEEFRFSQIEGRNVYTPNGGREDAVFEVAALGLLPGIEEFATSFDFFLTYESEFRYADTVCIKTDLHDFYDGGCQDATVSRGYSGQGSPVGVKRLRQEVLPDHDPRVRFHFDVGNLGGGRAREVRVRNAMLGGQPLLCEFRGYDTNALRYEFGLDEQDAELLCEIVLEDSLSFESTLSLQFDYTYEESEQQRVTIKR